MLFDVYTYLLDVIAGMKIFPVTITIPNNMLIDMIFQIRKSDLQFICNSEMINEPIEVGGYEYYYTEIDDIMILYNMPTHYGMYPTKIMLFNDEFMFNINNETYLCEVCRIPQNLLNILKIKDPKIRQKELTYMLYNSDR